MTPYGHGPYNDAVESTGGRRQLIPGIPSFEGSPSTDAPGFSKEPVNRGIPTAAKIAPTIRYHRAARAPRRWTHAQ